MTPQILLDALRKAYFRLGTVCLMIMDECHRATGNHPYTKIMKVNISSGNFFSPCIMCCACVFSCLYSFCLLVKEFYHKSDNKPKIFGMTASPVIRKGTVSGFSCIFGQYITACINIIASCACVILHSDLKCMFLFDMKCKFH